MLRRGRREVRRCGGSVGGSKGCGLGKSSDVSNLMVATVGLPMMGVSVGCGNGKVCIVVDGIFAAVVTVLAKGDEIRRCCRFLLGYDH